MILSVIVPDSRPGMQQMLQRELQDIDCEIIYEDWCSGLMMAEGDFVVLLEEDSAVSRGSIIKQLSVFLENRHYRKLAMVSPLIEYNNTKPMSLSSNLENMKYPQMTRVGAVSGAVIRRTSLLKHIELLEKDITKLSDELSVLFWENGLRIMLEPTCTYYSPSDRVGGGVIQISNGLRDLWLRECIL